MIEIKKGFYLNLDRRTDRKEHIENEISKTFLNHLFERFPAINGLEIHPRNLPKGLITQNALEDILADTVTSWGLSLTQGGLGILLSYLEMFKIISNMDGSVIIFEDDSVVSDDFNNDMIHLLNELPEDYDICYLGYGGTNIEKTLFSKSLSIPTGAIFCTPALIVSPKGATKMLELLNNIDNQFDTALYKILPKLNAYVSNKLIIEIKNQFKTDIQGNDSCKKNYVKQNYIITTLAYGDFANQNAMNFAMDLKFFNQNLLVVTNKKGFFKNLNNVIEIEYPSDVFSYNKKIICIEEGLKRCDAVVYMDSDTRIFYETYKNAYSNFFINIEPGFHPSFNWGKITRENNYFFTSKDINERVPGYGEIALDLARQLNIDIDSASHYQEGMIVISKDNGKEKKFLDIWKLFAETLDNYELKKGKIRLGVGEGNLIGLSLVASDIKINDVDICNLLGENLKYNFGGNKQEYIKNYPNRKILKSSENKIIFKKDIFVVFDSKEVSLSYSIFIVEDDLLLLSFEWNKNNAIQFLDHEFRINGEVFHFNSDKTNEFYFENKPNLIIEHTYDWFGERNWIEHLRKNDDNIIMDYGNVEIHTLICNRDLVLAINNFKSLQKFEEFANMPVYLHDDGSLTDLDIDALKIIKNVNVIKRPDADKLIEPFIKNYPNCISYRLGNNHINLWHKIKTFDYFFFSKTKKILGMDSDLLFLRKPEDVIKYINSETPFYYPDIQNAYSFNEPKDEIPVLDRVNTGLIYIPSEDYFNIDSLEFALTNLLKDGINYFPSWIEQSAFAHMFKVDGRYVSLRPDAYRIPYFQPIDIKLTECLHFVSFPAVRETYKEYLGYLEFGVGDIMNETNFVVKFKNKEIPVRLSIFKYEEIYNFEYYWGLDQVDQEFLDHIFEITTDDGVFVKKLQSNKNGFFVINTKSKKMLIRHTYDWFGEYNWKQIYLRE